MRPIDHYTLNDYETIAGCDCFICAQKCFARGNFLIVVSEFCTFGDE